MLDQRGREPLRGRSRGHRGTYEWSLDDNPVPGIQLGCRPIREQAQRQTVAEPAIIGGISIVRIIPENTHNQRRQHIPVTILVEMNPT
nr:hypothetical protein [Mycobacteroides abscessus]